MVKEQIGAKSQILSRAVVPVGSGSLGAIASFWGWQAPTRSKQIVVSRVNAAIAVRAPPAVMRLLAESGL